MNIFSFKDPRKVMWHGDHAGEADVYLVAQCADAEVAKTMVALAQSLGAAADEISVLDFSVPTSIVIDCGSYTHTDEVLAMVLVTKQEHAELLAESFRVVHAHHYVAEDGRLHWSQSGAA